MRHLITSLLHAIAPKSAAGASFPASPPASPGPSPTKLQPTDPYEIKAALRELNAVPRSELPDGPARDALAEAIRAGAVIDVYRPASRDWHVLELAHTHRGGDPRRTIVEWITAWGLSQSCRGLTPALDFLLAMRDVGQARGGR